MAISNKKTYEKGLNIRTEVLGSEYVEPNIEKGRQDDFHGAIQDVVTEYCWGMGWGREGVLDRKTRSMLTLAMLTALKASGIESAYQRRPEKWCLCRTDQGTPYPCYGLLWYPCRGGRFSKC